ncbi:MAG: carboxypeptidase regulatory-like domain-containing protein, partial [Verrucomicrobia bacterium]|nr:carboxypeptidase regulatory-like domain-containing protein [Verrucomicrobiota bacterium]
MRVSHFVRWFGFGAGWLWATGLAHGEAAGGSTLRGKVTDAATGRPVAGATVQAETRTVAVDGEGMFALAELPAGRHMLAISAPGHARVEQTIELQPGPNTLAEVRLPVEGVQVMEKFVLTEKTEGASAKFNNKSGSDALVEVVSGAELKNPNAQSSGDLLKNTSGVTVSSGAGGASNVSVRGIDQRMLRITVDGQRQGGTGNAL